MSKTCMVTGGAGFIGCALSTKLADRFDRVVVIDSLHPQIHAERKRPAELDPRVELMVADVTEASTWAQALETTRPEVVVHLAAETGTGQSLTEASRHAIANVLGTTRMLDAFATVSHVPERFVLASSRAVYGEGAWRSRNPGEVTYPGQRSKQQLERAELIERMQADPLVILGEGIVLGDATIPDDAGDRLRLRHTLLLDQQFQRAVATTTSGYLEHAGLLAVGIDDRTNAQLCSSVR